MNDNLFEVRDLKRFFPSGKRTVKALDGVSFALHRGETLSLVGESGCGKTTCARMLLGVYPPTAGTVLWNGKNSSALSRAERTEFRKKNQMVFQDPYACLDPRMTVSELIGEGMKRHFSHSADQRREIVRRLLETVGLTAEFASRFPHELSGGQRQRVGIARALALEPECLVCDEPIAALDVSIQAQIINLLMRLQAERGLTYLMISHDLTMVRHISDRIAVMYLGVIVELSGAERLYENPLHPYTKALLSAIPEAEPGISLPAGVFVEKEEMMLNFFKSLNYDDGLSVVTEILKKFPLQYGATLGLDGDPQIRPIEFKFADDGVLYFDTVTLFTSYAELLAHPYIQICVCDSETMSYVRLGGKVNFTEDADIIARCFDSSEILTSQWGNKRELVTAYYLTEVWAEFRSFSDELPNRTYKLTNKFDAGLTDEGT